MKIIFKIISIIIISTQSSFADITHKKTKFTIFSGDKKASYYAVASGICHVFNLHYGNKYECQAVESKGSAGNLRSLVSGEADLGIIKTSKLNQLFIKDSPKYNYEKNFITRIHSEHLTILVQKDLNITSISDLKNKSVNIGSEGSSSALVSEKYISKFSINPKKTHHLGASEAFKMMCNNKIDAWIYFIGHPNKGYKKVLDKCNLEMVSIPNNEIENFLSIAPYFEKGKISEKLYSSLSDDVKTISSPTLLSSRDNVDPNIINLIKLVLQKHKKELIEENRIFQSFVGQ